MDRQAIEFFLSCHLLLGKVQQWNDDVFCWEGESGGGIHITRDATDFWPQTAVIDMDDRMRFGRPAFILAHIFFPFFLLISHA